MATKQVYVIKVRSSPPQQSQLLPSERRYSAQGVLGLSCVHLALACLAAVLAALRAHVNAPFWPFLLVPFAAGSSGTAGLLAWRRWYEGLNIRLLLAASSVSCLTCAAVALADVLTRQAPLSPEVHAVLVSGAEAAWSAVTVLVSWRGVRNKGAGEEVQHPSPHTAVTAPSGWCPSFEDPKRASEARVLEYLRGYRPPVEGKEKCGDDDLPEIS